MDQKKVGSLIFILFIFTFGFSSNFVRSLSVSCSSNLSSVSHLIPFNNSISSMRCVSAWSSEGFILRYAKSGPGQWSYILSAPDTGSYISIGFSKNGRMVGSDAVVGWISANGPGIAKQYYLGGESSHQCKPDQGSLPLIPGKLVIISQSSTLYLAFQLNIVDPQPYAIYAVGPKNRLPSGDYYLSEHRNMASASINYITGEISDAEDSSSGFALAPKHGLLVILGWGVLIPIGILIARYLKQWDPFWFYSHISIQGIGFVLGLVGIIIGFNLDDEEGGNVERHKALGICILVLGFLQVMAFLVRPAKESKVRKYWNWYHRYVGRAAVAFAVGNIFYGLSLLDEASSWRIVYGVFLAIWVLACVILEFIRCTHDK